MSFEFPGDPIYSFSDNFRFLSNFYAGPAPIRFESRDYPTVEHAYQAAKTMDRDIRKTISYLTAGQAKRYGGKLALRPGWDDMKIDVMRLLLREKFSHPDMARKLQDTAGRELIEGNSWGDSYWGMITTGDHMFGDNHLGKLLMEIREEINDQG